MTAMLFKKGARTPIRIQVYSKPDCHLCDDVKKTIENVAKDFELNVEHINILDSEALFEKFKSEIPVIYINGRKAFKYQVSEPSLIQRLKKET